MHGAAECGDSQPEDRAVPYRLATRIAESPADYDRLRAILIGSEDAAVRIQDDWFLVPWDAAYPGVWCVVNLADLDAHVDRCSEFRYRRYCQHLKAIEVVLAGERTPGS